MILSFTGYRPEKLPNKETGYIIPNPTYNYVCKETERLLRELKPDMAISGMALGFDQWAANVCIKLGIPFIASIPFIDQERMWVEKSKRQYHYLLSKASKVIIVSEGGYAAYKMQKRNEFMVDSSDKVLACIRNDETSGGTFNCVQYAKKQSKEIITIDPSIALGDK